MDLQALSTIWADLWSILWLEWAKVTFDLLKGVSWPAAAFAAVWIFRDAIRARIPFITQLGPSGAVFQVGQPTGHPNNPLHAADHPLETVNELANSIVRELQDYLPDQKEPRLIRALAEARTLANFELIFGAIFQSQIDALRELSAGPKTFAEAHSFFEERVKPMNRELYSTVDFDQWSRFLVTQALVSLEGESVSITQKGRDFLDFVGRAKAGISRAN